MRFYHIDSHGLIQSGMTLVADDLGFTRFGRGVSLCQPIHTVEADACMRESMFELVRQHEFPHLPSRLRSFFGCSEDALDAWLPAFSSHHGVYEVECDTFSMHNEKFLEIYSAVQVDGQVFQAFQSDMIWENIRRYWGSAISNIPGSNIHQSDGRAFQAPVLPQFLLSEYRMQALPYGSDRWEALLVPPVRVLRRVL